MSLHLKQLKTLTPLPPPHKHITKIYKVYYFMSPPLYISMCLPTYLSICLLWLFTAVYLSQKKVNA